MSAFLKRVTHYLQALEQVLKHRPILTWGMWALLTALYLLWPIQTDFYTDEAYFSEMTLHVLQGQLPNYDFASNYLGLFYVYSAIWFALFGASYLSLRIGMLILTSTLFIPSVFFLAKKILSTRWAAAATLFVLALTVSFNYSVSGNWYALFFSMLAVSLTFSGKQTHWKRALLIGGILGISFLMKHTVALYTGIALFFSLLWDTLQTTSDEKTELTDSSPVINYITMGVCALLPFGALLLIQHHLDAFRLAAYVLPVTVISWRFFKHLFNAPQRYDTRPLWNTVGWFILGGLIPLILFCLPYAFKPNGISTLFQSVFINYPKIYLNQAFLDYAQTIDANSWLWSIGILLLCLFCKFQRRFRIHVIAIIALFVLFFSNIRQWNNTTVALYLQLPLWGIFLGSVYFLKTPLEHSLPESQRVSIKLWFWGTLLFLGTYPLGMMFYVGYTLLPFLLLFTYWIAKQSQPFFKKLGIMALTYACCFGALFAYRQVGWFVPPDGSIFPKLTFPIYLDWDRAKIHIPETTEYSTRTRLYKQLVDTYSKRADDWFMYSDGPEVYFLTHHTNPTRYSYAIDSTLSDGKDILDGLEAHNVQFVLMELGQNHFEQALVNDYLNQHFVLKKRVNQNILLFERRQTFTRLSPKTSP